MSLRQTVQEMNPLFPVALAAVVVFYLFRVRQGIIPQDEQLGYLVFAGLIIAMAFMTKEKRLLTIREAQKIAMKDIKYGQRNGLLQEQGRLILLEDAVTRRIVPDRYDVISVGILLEGESPVTHVYSIHPFTGYILRMSKMEYWDARKDPDLKIIPQPVIMKPYEMTPNFRTDVDRV